jgi:multiple sugar transport system substrate-binding protein
MGFREHDRRTFIADACGDLSSRRISKRNFLKKMTLAGVGFSAFASTFLGRGRPFGALTNQGTDLAAAQTPPDVEKWLREVGGKYRGTKIRYSTEATPPSIVANQLARDEFTKITGIEVEVEIVPLEQVLQKATLDVQGQLGTYDLTTSTSPDGDFSRTRGPQAYNATRSSRCRLQLGGLLQPWSRASRCTREDGRHPLRHPIYI